MQHKRQRRPQIGFILVLLIFVIGGGLLAFANPVAPTQPVEKQLDAKAFLGAKE